MSSNGCATWLVFSCWQQRDRFQIGLGDDCLIYPARMTGGSSSSPTTWHAILGQGYEPGQREPQLS